ncbi:MAG: alpha/beta fold hydrolase, partial [bacterium]|nr:alpha/beta fold hydrolase [bacterium]
MVRTRPKKNPGRFRTALIGYGLLVLLSNAFRAFYPSQHLPESGQKQVAIAGGMEIAYSESGSLGPDIPTIVLLHGSPMGAEMFSELLPILQQSCRVIVPDLVGYGASTPKAADYSIHAQAGYMLALMDALGLERAQVAGYSFGGGVAIAMADIAPGRIISLALLSSLGVQELELLGDSQLNRGIHGIQLALIWLLHEGTPHFGWLDTGLLSKAYARSFFDTDQVPLRGALTRYQKPMLIIHGRADFQVPPATAEEHHRIVPQSESVWLSGEHDLAGTHPGHLAEILSDFAHRVARGEAATRSDATPERIRLSEERFEGRALPRAQGAYFWVLMFLIILASLVSEDLACIGAGLMASRGILDFGSATLASLAGIVLGDMALYLAGRWLGRPILRYAPVRWFVTEARLDR